MKQKITDLINMLPSLNITDEQDSLICIRLLEHLKLLEQNLDDDTKLNVIEKSFNSLEQPIKHLLNHYHTTS